MSDPKPAGQGGDKKEKPELFKTLDGSPPKEPPADDGPKGPKPDKPDLLPNPWGNDDRPKPDIDIDKLPPLYKERFKDDKTPDDEDDITGGRGGGRGDDKGGPEVLAVASSVGASGVGAGIAAPNLDRGSGPGWKVEEGASWKVEEGASWKVEEGVSNSLNYEEMTVSIVAPEPDELGNFEIQDAMAPEPEGWSGSDFDD
jgi:hypothetical protein